MTTCSPPNQGKKMLSNTLPCRVAHIHHGSFFFPSFLFSFFSFFSFWSFSSRDPGTISFSRARLFCPLISCFVMVQVRILSEWSIVPLVGLTPSQPVGCWVQTRIVPFLPFEP
ncbi:hypothetical protein B0I35DRAFT_175325 [Stachybotrys elegans]|uniref:Uncharacterized protein n=1 Tax=Stachybotrys elegans TaxID=80388 RepID=A0A8K0WUB8_9HYPO|nr:hypothetical protein B0I35DRAFT_175325 [Stachybotrys elegans]